MDYSINTKCVQAGYTPGNGEPRQIPSYQSTTYKYLSLIHIYLQGSFFSCISCRLNRSCTLHSSGFCQDLPHV